MRRKTDLLDIHKTQDLRLKTDLVGGYKAQDLRGETDLLDVLIIYDWFTTNSSNKVVLDDQLRNTTQISLKPFILYPVLHLISNASCLASYVSRLMSCILCLKSCILYLMSKKKEHA